MGLTPKPNKYTRWYLALMAKRQAHPLRRQDQYLERHHITPKSLGGSNDPTNLVLLTPREHYVAHLLLTRMYDGDASRRLNFAFHSMRRESRKMQRYVSRLYEAAAKARPRVASAESREKMARSQRARAPFSVKHRERLAEGVRASYTPELRALRSAAQLGVPKSAAARKAMQVAAENRWSGPEGVEERRRLAELASSRTGVAAARSKTWSLLSPNGKLHLTSSCRAFCEEHGLSYHGLRNKAVVGDTTPVQRGPSKGWSVLACTEKC